MTKHVLPGPAIVGRASLKPRYYENINLDLQATLLGAQPLESTKQIDIPKAHWRFYPENITNVNPAATNNHIR